MATAFNPSDTNYTSILPPLPPMNVGQIDAFDRRRSIPSKPRLIMVMRNDGCYLSWRLKLGPQYAELQCYELCVFEKSLSPTAPLNTINEWELWKPICYARSADLPMSFLYPDVVDDHGYYFIVRAVDVYNRTGHFSDPIGVELRRSNRN